MSGAAAEGAAGAPGPAPAGRVLAAMAALKVLLHLPVMTRYGYFRDELYYLASTEHLDWGYVDHPPLSIAVLAVVRALFGDSLPALRAVPLAAGVATVWLVGTLARRLGGGAFAQGLAAFATVMAPVFLGTQHYYSMNALDLLLWAAAAHLTLSALERGTLRSWALLGAVLGLGLQNKLSVLWYLMGLAAALLATPHRRALRTRGPWVALVLALGIFAPNLAWQAAHGWPTAEFMRNATGSKMASVSLAGFAIQQVLQMNPGAAFLWLIGLGRGLGRAERRRGRVFVVLFLTAFAIVVSTGRSRASYLSVAYAPLLALGAVGCERLASRRGLGILRPALIVAVALGGLVAMPLALPLLPPATLVAYQRALGLAPRTEERLEIGALPQQFADMFGWPEMVALVERAYERLGPEERPRCRVFAQNYGEAGAVDVLGRRRGLPPALSGHNSYWLWGPGDFDADVLIIIGGRREDHARYFEAIETVGQTSSPWAMPYERGLDVWIARRPKVRLEEIWPRVRRYI